MPNDWGIAEIQMGDQNKESILNTMVRSVIQGVSEPTTLTFPSNADYTPPSASVILFRRLKVTGALATSTKNLIIPAINKEYLVHNNTSGGQSITVKTASGTGVTIANGARAIVYCDGLDCESY